MQGHLSQDTLVEVPAAVLWDVNRSLELGRLFNELLQNDISRVEVVQGDGGVGTILKITFVPGIPGLTYMKEKFITVDDKTCVKESEVIEGGYKDLGFEYCRYRLQIIEKDTESSIVRSSVEYEIDDKLKEFASQVITKPMEMLAEGVGKYLKEKRSSSNWNTCYTCCLKRHGLFISRQ